MTPEAAAFFEHHFCSELGWNILGVCVFFGFMVSMKQLLSDRSYLLTVEIAVFAFAGVAELLVKLIRSAPSAPPWHAFPEFFPDGDVRMAAGFYVVIAIVLLSLSLNLDFRERRESGTGPPVPWAKLKSRALAAVTLVAYLVTRTCFDHIPITIESH